MEIITSSAIANPVTIFSLGTVFGATSVYYFLRMRRKLDPPTAVPLEERFEVRIFYHLSFFLNRYQHFIFFFKFPDLRDEYRLIMGIRNDLKMQKGKVGAQCGHAAVAAYAKALKYRPKTLSRWMQFGKIYFSVFLYLIY